MQNAGENRSQLRNELKQNNPHFLAAHLVNTATLDNLTFESEINDSSEAWAIRMLVKPISWTFACRAESETRQQARRLLGGVTGA